MLFSLKEKRVFPRIRLRTPLRYRIRGLPELASAISDNVSLGGIGFINNGFVAPDTSVGLEINILSRILSPTGRVAWSEPIPHSDRYRIGVEFSEINPIEKNYLSDYINMQTDRL